MKRLAIVFALALSLGGCANLPKIIDLATTSVTNPVTPEMVYRVENGMIVAVSGLLAYKNACIQHTIDQACRGVVQRLQIYTRQAEPVIKDLRRFVRDNDQVNAVKAYNLVSALLDSFKSTAVASGVN
jgi:hypothetical protein